MNAASFHSWWTVVLLVIFVGIALWAFSPRRRKHFEDAGHIPLEDDDAPAARRTDSKTKRGKD